MATNEATAPRRAAKTTAKKSATKKLSPTAASQTAEIFFTFFKTLPGSVRSRIIELIEAEEDSTDLRELEAARAASPADFDPINSPTLEEYMRQRPARS